MMQQWRMYVWTIRTILTSWHSVGLVTKDISSRVHARSPWAEGREAVGEIEGCFNRKGSSNPLTRSRVEVTKSLWCSRVYSSMVAFPLSHGLVTSRPLRVVLWANEDVALHRTSFARRPGSAACGGWSAISARTESARSV